MKKVTLLVAAVLCSLGSFAQEQYPINWDKDANLTFTVAGRQTSSVSITVDGEEQTIDVLSKSNVVYRDFSDQTFTVQPGAEIVPSMAYAGQWMHGYVYLDTNNNGAFDVNGYDDQTDELVAFSFYSPNGGSNGVNGIGQSKQNNCNVNPMNAFKAPEKPGEYRMRYIVDWNCIDPAGQYGSNYSDNFINANGGVIVDVTLVVEGAVEPEPTVPTMSISAVFPNGNEHVVYAYEGKLTASATVPEGAISNFEIVSNEGDVYVLKAGDQYLHWTSGDNTSKSADLDGLNEEFDESINYLTIKLGNEAGLQSTTWDKAPIASLYEVIGNGTNGQAFNFTLRENDDAWIAGDSGMKFFDTNWDGNGCRTSYFRVEMSETPVTPVDPEPPVVEGPQAAFTLTNLSSTADNYSFPIEVPAEFAAPVLEAKATTTVIEFVKTAGNKAAFVASTDGGNNFYANITLADNRIGFDYMMDNGAEGWFTKTQAPYTNLNTTVRVALTQDEESGLLNWYDAETGQQINSTNVSTNSAWGARSFGSKGYSHLYVGGYLDAAGNAQYVFPGEIASVRVYPQLLTTEEMTSLTWEGLEDSFDYIPEAPAYDYAKEVAPVLAEANAALEGHDNVWVTTVGDKLITKASQFSSPFSQNDLGAKDGQNLSDGCLIDNNNNTFWHSVWSQGNKAAHSHYLQVELDEAIDGDVLLTFVRRNAANDQVTRFDVEASIDGQNFTHAAYIDMPNSGAGKTEQKTFALEEKAKFLRFWADATTNNRGYWHCAEFQLQTVETNLNVDAPDYAYPEAVAALQEAIATAQAVQNGTQEDVDALVAAVEAYKAAIAGYPEFTEWTGDIQVVAGEVKTIDDLLNVDVCFNRALSLNESEMGVLGVVFDESGDAYAMVFDAICGEVEYDFVKSAEFVGRVAHVTFAKIDDLTFGLKESAKAAASKIGAFGSQPGNAVLALSSKSFLIDGEKLNEFVCVSYELGTGTITGVNTVVLNSKGEVYDLQGRRANNAQNGLFIQNGRVVLK